MSTCIELGLPVCNFCRWNAEDQRKSLGKECWVYFYERIISDKYIRARVINRSKHYTPTYHIYFLAALKRNPELSAIYEKLMVLA